MKRHHVMIAVVVGLLAMGGWGWAQQRNQPHVPVQPPTPVTFTGGPFAVSPVGQSAILVETSSGKTWEMTRSAEGQVVWLPCKRIDSEKEAEEWRQIENRKRQQLEEERRIHERERRIQEREDKLKQVQPAAGPLTGASEAEKRIEKK